MRAIWKDRVIAESDDTVVVEGNHYFPAEALDMSVLVASERTSICPWKGRAHYHHIEVDGERNEDAVWHYPSPTVLARKVEGRFAFWKGVQVVD